MDADIDGIPFTVVGDQYFIGWRNEETTGVIIENAIKENLAGNNSNNFIAGIDTKTELDSAKSVSTKEKSQKENLGLEEISKTVKLPLLGEIEIKIFLY